MSGESITGHKTQDRHERTPESTCSWLLKQSSALWQAYQIDAVQAGMKLAVRGDTSATHMTYYNVVRIALPASSPLTQPHSPLL